MKRSTQVLLEQILTSLSSGLLLLSLVAITAPRIFGAISLVYVIMQLALAVLRFAVFLPLHTKGTGHHLSGDRRSTNALLSAAAGIVVGAAAVAITWITFREFTLEAALVAACTPFVFVNESLRQSALAIGRMSPAIAASSLWTGFSLLAFGLSLLRVGTPGALIVLWGLGATASLVRLAVRWPVDSATQGRGLGLRGIADHLPTRPYLLFGTLIPTSIFVLQLCIAQSAGSAVYGELAANILAWTPISVLLASLPVLASRLRSRLGRSPGTLIGQGVAFAVVPVAIWGGILVLLGSSLLPVLLAGTAPVVVSLVPVSIVLWAVTALQGFLLMALLLRDDDRGAAWLGMAGLVVRAIVGIGVLTQPGLPIGWYVFAEAGCHAVLAAFLALRLARGASMHTRG